MENTGVKHGRIVKQHINDNSQLKWVIDRFNALLFSQRYVYIFFILSKLNFLSI